MNWADLIAKAAAPTPSRTPVGFGVMVGNPGANEYEVVYVPACPHCEGFHEFHIRFEEWTGRTSVKGYLEGAKRECVGRPFKLIVTRYRSARTG